MIELVPLCTVTVSPEPAIDLGVTPSGRRMMVTITQADWRGERLNAHLKSGTVAADWMIIGPDGVGLIDIRVTLETDDNALIYVHYQGRRDITSVMQGVDAPVYIAPVFETGDGRYQWLNKVQAIGKGTMVGDVRVYDVYEVR